MFTQALKRLVHTSSWIHKNHYQVLGVGPKATQAEIKAAYYKLSLIYHPDRNEGDVAKFQAITSAYEILGNYNSRKMYDKGMDTIYDGTSSTAPGTTATRERYKAPMATGRTPVYDFDEWSRIHYGKAFARKAEAKFQYQQRTNVNTDINVAAKKENVVIFIIVLFLVVTFLSHLTQNDLDRVPQESAKNETQRKPS